MKSKKYLWLAAYLIVVILGGLWTIEPRNRVGYFLVVLPLGTALWLLTDRRRWSDHGGAG